MHTFHPDRQFDVLGFRERRAAYNVGDGNAERARSLQQRAEHEREQLDNLANQGVNRSDRGHNVANAAGNRAELVGRQFGNLRQFPRQQTGPYLNQVGPNAMAYLQRRYPTGYLPYSVNLQNFVRPKVNGSQRELNDYLRGGYPNIFVNPNQFMPQWSLARDTSALQNQIRGQAMMTMWGQQQARNAWISLNRPGVTHDDYKNVWNFTRNPYPAMGVPPWMHPHVVQSSLKQGGQYIPYAELGERYALLDGSGGGGRGGELALERGYNEKNVARDMHKRVMAFVQKYIKTPVNRAGLNSDALAALDAAIEYYNDFYKNAYEIEEGMSTPRFHRVHRGPGPNIVHAEKLLSYFEAFEKRRAQGKQVSELNEKLKNQVLDEYTIDIPAKDFEGTTVVVQIFNSNQTRVIDTIAFELLRGMTKRDIENLERYGIIFSTTLAGNRPTTATFKFTKHGTYRVLLDNRELPGGLRSVGNEAPRPKTPEDPSEKSEVEKAVNLTMIALGLILDSKNRNVTESQLNGFIEVLEAQLGRVINKLSDTEVQDFSELIRVQLKKKVGKDANLKNAFNQVVQTWEKLLKEHGKKNS